MWIKQLTEFNNRKNRKNFGLHKAESIQGCREWEFLW